MTRKIIICGKAGSGKDYLKNYLQKEGMTCVVRVTTRPPRTGEVEGQSYFFLSNEEFEKKILANEFIQYRKFNGWYYGTTKKIWNESSVLIMSPGAISDLLMKCGINRYDLFIIYIDIPEDIRRKRLTLRSDADSVERRIAADKIDFEVFDFEPDLFIYDPLFDPQKIYHNIKEK